MWLPAVAFSFLLVACGSYQDIYKNLDEDVSHGNYLEAANDVQKHIDEYGEKGLVLYHMDLGLLYHYAGLPDSSTPYFFAAERLIEDLYTKSVSLAAASMLTNDNILPYDGEDFERALINVFLALNYAQKEDTEGALVEARKVDLKLREFSRQYEGKNKYQEDAFIRYVGGVLYENGGELNDAFISYRKAYETYKLYEQNYSTRAPSFLLDDLVRTATLLRFTEEAESFRAAGGKPFEESSQTLGGILCVTYAGKGPIKQELKSTVSIPDDEGTLHTFQVALPKFVPRYGGRRDYTLTVRSAHSGGDALSAQTELAEDVTAIAQKNLEDRLSIVYLKSGGRALLKFLAAEKAKAELKKNDDATLNFLGSLAVDLVVGATEQADLRVWRTLPAEFRLARVSLEPGDYLVNISSSDGGFRVSGQRVRVVAGKTSFVLADDIR